MRSGLPWNELFQLHVIRKVGKIVNRRWNLGLGYIDAETGSILPPRSNHFAPSRSFCTATQERETGSRNCKTSALTTLETLKIQAERTGTRIGVSTTTCHAGLTELAAPIVLEGKFAGAILCGGFLLSEDRPQVPNLDKRKTLPVVEVETRQENMPQLNSREVEFIAELIEEVAVECAAFLLDWTENNQEPQAAAPPPSPARYSYDAIIGKAEPMQQMYRLLDRLVESDSTVLVQGENGTGKELVARAIHYNSSRKNRRFVVQNCSAFNDNLLDSELFGHKRGAFTGAVSDKQGLFEVADQGTFFLDEIGDMSPSLQVKVLRVLQEGTFTPVGDTESKKVDVRVIAATNRDLRTMVDRGEFREDLYYRINVINLTIPPLRERRDDIEILVEHFLKRHSKSGRRQKNLSQSCFKRLLSYRWPGNVRELENEMERLVVLSGDDSTVSEDLLSARIRQATDLGDAQLVADPRSLPDAVKALERRMIHAALKRHNWNKTRAAAELKISRRNLIRLVQKYELTPEIRS